MRSDICDRLEIEFPLFAFSHCRDVVAAVSKAGGYGVLGALAARASLGTDGEGESGQDTTSPRNSALLRGFMVYLALIAGVLMFGDDPAAPTQKQYVRLAGFMSLVAFVINYRPSLFGKLLQRAGATLEGKPALLAGKGEPPPS